MKVNEGYYICQPAFTLSPPIFENFNRYFRYSAFVKRLRFPLFRVYPATDHGRIGNQSAAREKPAHIIRYRSDKLEALTRPRMVHRERERMERLPRKTRFIFSL